MPFRNNPAAKLLTALVLLMVTAPFVEDLPHGDLIESVLLSLVMLMALGTVRGQRKSLVAGLLLLVPAIGGKWVHHFHPNLLHPAVYLIGATGFFGIVIWRLLSSIVRAPRVNSAVLCAGVAGFLLMGLLWVPVYTAVARIDPGAFNVPSAPGTTASFDGYTAYYFSFITLCTIGYGDVTPVSRLARGLAVIEALAGLFYMAVMISRLVSLHSSSPDPDGGNKPD